MLIFKKYLILIFGLLFLVNNAIAKEPDWTSYQAVLQHIKPGIRNDITFIQVDYQAINTTGSLDKAYEILSSFDLEQLSGRNEKLAFYINAYNIMALKMVADHWPIDSIKDAGSLFGRVWSKVSGSLGGKPITLGEIEHLILRKMGDPRIHLAIVCASISCPDLRNEPYAAAKLNEQLDEQSRQFLNNAGKGLKIEKNAIRLSKIFDWFEDDFKVSGGVMAFIKHYRTDLPALKIKADIPYNWAVNAVN